METTREYTLRRNQVRLVDDLDPKDVLDVLLDDGVLTENDYEHINTGKSRKERCRILLAMLPTRGPVAYGSFQRALKQSSYAHLEELLHIHTLSDGDKHSLSVTDTGSKDALQLDKKTETGSKNALQLHQITKTGSKDALQLDKVTQTGSKNALQLDQVSVCSKCQSIFPTKFSDPELSVALKRNCCLLLGNVEPCDILDWHYQEFVLGRDECDRVRSKNTRKERFVVFLEEISKCQSKNVLSVFKMSLQKKYGFLVGKLESNLSTVPKDVVGRTMESVQHSVVRDSTVRKTIDCITREQDASVVLCLQQEPDIHCDQATSSFDIDTAPYLTTVVEQGLQYHWQDTVAKSSQPTFEQTSEIQRTTSMEQSIDISCRSFDQATAADLRPQCSRADSLTKWSPISAGDFEALSSDLEHLALSQADSACVPKHQLRPTSKSHLQTNKRPTTQTGYSTDSEEDMYSKQFKQRSTSKKQERDAFENKTGNNKESSRDNRKYILSVNPGSLTPCTLPKKRLEVAFNFLSTMINQGQFDRFEQFSIGLKHKYHRNADMMCILGYLHASKDLFKTDFDSAKKHISSAMELVPKTSNPKYFTLELFTALTRMYITQKKLQKLQRTLDDAKMIIETDPVGCTGRAAGWLYMNDARNTAALIGMLNVHKSNFTNSYRNLHAQAKRSFQLSLVNFQRDGGKDGPFGFGYALCRLAILLLQCGDSGLTMDVLHPDYDDIELAGGYLRQLEDSNIPIPKILEVHYLLAKCDYQYRRANSVRALEHAEAAHRLATEINMLEFTEHAHNRVIFLRTKTPLFIETVDEEEASRILFEESADSSQ